MKKTALLLALALAAAGIAGGALADEAGDAQPTAEVQVQYQALEHGDESEAVRALMQRLADLGYYKSSSVDDQFGPGMARAVKLFNARCGIAGGEVATEETQARAFADDAPVYDIMPPVIEAVTLEEYEGRQVFSVSAYNPQESDVTFLSVIYRCYDVNGNLVFATEASPAAIGTEPMFGKYDDLSLKCGDTVNLRGKAAFDLSAYQGVEKVEAALYCYQAGGEMYIVPEQYFVWVSSDGKVSGTPMRQSDIALRNRTPEQDGLATRFAMGAQLEHVFAFESAHYGVPVGLYLRSVSEGGVLSASGLQAGDVITSIAGVAMDFEEALYIVKAQMEPNVDYAMEYWRSGQTYSTTISWSQETEPAQDAAEPDADSGESGESDESDESDT